VHRRRHGRGALRRALRAAAILALAAPALAEDAPQPPVWAYLAECSAVFGAVSQSEGYAAADPATVAGAAATSDRFLARAIMVAGEMGQADPAADVGSIMAYLVPRWEGRIEKLLSVKSNMDWIAYCGRLGREQGVIPN
jgi:hypothetical protein